MKTGRRLAKIAAVVVGLGVVGVVGASGAWAHVTVSAPGVSAGDSDATITFRVPTESATASTVELKLQIPIAPPIAGVLVAPQPGWTAKITQTKLAGPVHTDDGDITQVVSEIDWTADPTAAIKPGFFGQFTIIAGKLPDGVSDLTFKAIQTYSDGTQAAWIEVPGPGSSTEPDHPAPTLKLTAAGGGSASPRSSAAAPSSPAFPSAGVATVSATAAASSSTGASTGAAATGIALGVLGIVLGGAALLLALRRGRGSSAN